MNCSLLKTLEEMARLEQPKPLYTRFSNPQVLAVRARLCAVEHCPADSVNSGGTAGRCCLCPDHYLLASQVTRRKHSRALFWQGAMEKCFSEAAIYDRIVATGRHLKLCMMTERAMRWVDETWGEVILDAMTSAEKRPLPPRSAHQL